MVDLDQEKLIRAVVAEVIRLLAGRTAGSGRSEKVLLVLTGGTLGFNEAVDSLITACPGVSYHLVCTAASRNVHRLAGLKERLKPEAVVEAAEADPWELLQGARAVAVPALTRSTAAKVANAYFDGLGAQVILEALMAGLPVVAARDAADPANPGWRALGLGAPAPGLARALNENLRRLETLGVVLVQAGEMGPALSTLIAGPEKSQPGGQQNHGRRRLISSREIVAAAGSAVIRLEPGDIVTPLARDLAAQQKVRLMVQGED
ncbi:MAG: glycosyltransferase family protein [Desulfocucumaceae bacterium]